jgi:DNA topoisomerase IB
MLSLPQHAFEAQQHVEFIWEVTGEPSEAAEIIGKESAKVALGAVNLARDLRKQFDLPSRDLRFGNLDVEESLQETINAKSQ